MSTWEDDEASWKKDRWGSEGKTSKSGTSRLGKAVLVVGRHVAMGAFGLPGILPADVADAAEIIGDFAKIK